MRVRSNWNLVIVISLLSSAGACALWAQETELRSILKSEDDLRPLIELNAPVAPEPIQEAAEPTLLQLTADEPKPTAAISKAATKATPSIVSGDARPVKSTDTVADSLINFGIITKADAGGLLIRGVLVDSLAARSGFVAGDRVLSIGSTARRSNLELRQELTRLAEGSESFSVTVQSGSAARRIQVVQDLATLSDSESPNRSSLPKSVIRSASAKSQPRSVESIARPTPLENSTATSQPRKRTVEPGTRRANNQRSVLRRNSDSPNARRVARNPSDRQVDRPATAAATNAAPTSQRVLRPTQPSQAVRTRNAVPYYQSPQQQVVRGQAPAAKPVPRQASYNQPQRPVQQRPVQQRPVQQRPVIGEGGRLIGNGRVLNSARRIFGL